MREAGGRAGGAGPATLTLEAASAVATRVHPGCVVVADAPHHAPAVGLHHPQVASHLPPEPGDEEGGRGGEKLSRRAFQRLPLCSVASQTSCFTHLRPPMTDSIEHKGTRLASHWELTS